MKKEAQINDCDRIIFSSFCKEDKPRFIIGNGGAGITRFVDYMAESFLAQTKAEYCIAWKKSDTEETLQGLANGSIDVGWAYGIERVYKEYKERNYSFAPVYIFRDHFTLIGSLTNPAALPISEELTPHYSNHQVLKLFKKIASGQSGVYFLTRNDKSATNFIERKIFKKILGRLPEVGTDSWYFPLKSKEHYPDTALQEANERGYYTLTDRGIWNWADPDKRKNLRVFCEAGDINPNDILLNPCLAMLKNTTPPIEAIQFVEWLANSGQAFIEEYKLHRVRLYSKGPIAVLNHF